MENNGFNVPMGMSMSMSMGGENFIIQDENMVSFGQKTFVDQNHIMPGFPMLSMIPNEVLNGSEHFGSNFPSIGNMDVPISATTLAALLASRNGQHESLNFPPFGQALEVPKTVVSNNYFPNSLPSSFNASESFGYDGTLNDMSRKWELNKYFTPTIERMGYNTQPNGWISSDNNPSVSSDGNELSLSLATCSGTSNLSIQASSCNSGNLSLGFDSNTNRPVQVLQCSSGTNGYLHTMQEILTEIASYSLGNLDHISYKQMNSDDFFDDNNKFEDRFSPVLKSRSVEATKKHLLALLEMVCHQASRFSIF